jgi:5-methylcytosine-specific restriction endonuclease McrA
MGDRAKARGLIGTEVAGLSRRQAQKQRRPASSTRAATVLQAPLETAVECTAPRTRTSRRRSGSRDPRYSSARWLRETRAFIALHPLCQCGFDCMQPSEVVDHHLPVKEHDDLFWDRSNWRALADRCHRLKSRFEQGERGELAPVQHTGPRVKGCDVRGYPRDPAHPWHRS